MTKLTSRFIAIVAAILFADGLFAAPAVKRAAVTRTATTVRRAQRAAAVDHARTRRPWYGGYRYYYWYDDDDCHHGDYVKNATCVLKVRKKLSDSSGLFEVKCSVGYVSVDRSNVKPGTDYSLQEKQQIRIDGIDMTQRHSGDTLYLPSSKNLWYNGEYRDPHGKTYQCYTLNADEAAAYFK